MVGQLIPKICACWLRKSLHLPSVPNFVFNYRDFIPNWISKLHLVAAKLYASLISPKWVLNWTDFIRGWYSKFARSDNENACIFFRVARRAPSNCVYPRSIFGYSRQHADKFFETPKRRDVTPIRKHRNHHEEFTTSERTYKISRAIMIFITSIFFSLLRCIGTCECEPSEDNGFDGDRTYNSSTPNEATSFEKATRRSGDIRGPYWEFLKNNRSVSQEWRAGDIPFLKKVEKKVRQVRNQARPICKRSKCWVHDVKTFTRHVHREGSANFV